MRRVEAHNLCNDASLSTETEPRHSTRTISKTGVVHHKNATGVWVVAYPVYRYTQVEQPNKEQVTVTPTLLVRSSSSGVHQALRRTTIVVHV